MIPDCIRLPQEATESIKKWVRSKGPTNPDDVDCCGTSSVTFEICASGIGDCINIKYKGFVLTCYQDDDDGRWVQEEVRK